MLGFFRKYQKIVFIFITIVIVISFVFFGTYQAFVPQSKEGEKTTFVDSQGRKITLSYFSDFCRFLAYEPMGSGFPNFLNDHVITKDFLQTDMGWLLLKIDKEKIEEDLHLKLSKEKHFRPYSHPYIPDLSAEKVWSSFAPMINIELQALKNGEKEKTKEALQSRIALFLAEKSFPGDLLTYILRYHENTHPDFPKDPQLNQPLPLFGYQNLSDWFGPHFVEAGAKCIIAGGAFAREQGYKVSKEEILAHITYVKEKAFAEVKGKSRFPNSYALYSELLQVLQLDESRVISILEDIFLFRRLLSDVSYLPFADAFALESFYEKAHECVEVEISRLPEEFCFKNEGDLRKFETYLSLVSKKEKEGLVLPSTFDSIEEIKKRAPFLLSSHFVVDLAHVSKKNLEGKVTIKEGWEWEEKNLSKLKVEFPNYQSDDRSMRGEIEAYTRKMIVDAHPEWVDAAIKSAKKEEKSLTFLKCDLAGITRPQELKELLEKEGNLPQYTQDGINFYNISLKEKKEETLLTFKEAYDAKLLDDTFVSLEMIFEEGKKLGVITSSFEEAKPILPTLRLIDLLANKDALWKVKKNRETIFPYTASLITFAQAKELSEEGKLFISEKGELFFARLIDRRVENRLPLDKMLLEEKIVADEVKYHLVKRIIDAATFSTP